MKPPRPQVSEKIPGWRRRPLGECFALQRGFDITQAEQCPGEVPVVSSSGITSFHNRAKVQGPGVVIGRKGNLGGAYFLKGPFWPHDTTLWVYKFHGNDPAFGAYFLKHMRLERFDAATSVPTLNRNVIHPIQVELPDPPEQKAIVEVLDTLDEAIQGTALVIDKLEHSRQGALRELLACGLDQAGRVRWRGDRTLFKDTPIGALPRDWSVAPLGAVLDRNRDPAMRSGPFGSALLKQDLVEEGHPLIGIDNVEVERFVPNFTRFITPAKFSDLSRYRSFPNDVLITIMGTVGRCCMVPEGLEDATTTKHVWALSIDPDLYSPFLVCLQINHAPWALRHLTGDQQGGIMSAIRAETLRSVLLPVPPKEEREAIESVLRSMGESIRIEQKRLQKLQALKSGLSTDLLTGHVRTQ